jgi:hypothetical protein
MMNAMGGKFEAVMTKYQPNPQAVADAALALVNMEKGKRPLRTPVDPIAQGVDLEYDQATTEIRNRWNQQYGF